MQAASRLQSGGVILMHDGYQTTISSWTATVTLTAPQQVSTTWNGSPTWNGNVMTMKPDGNGNLGAGASTTFGFTVMANGQWAAPTVACRTP